MPPVRASEHGENTVNGYHYGNGWRREPGMTEDGVERRKHMITAWKRPLRETADALHGAFTARLARMKAYVETMDA
ncbi:MAG TPA: hypothetical protein DCM87_07775 [Planctomycetes bacterium]|nr:hypothetical protein [Planctomycetota bacterium]